MDETHLSIRVDLPARSSRLSEKRSSPYIADRDDSDQFSLVNYGKVANSLVGHHRHAFFRS